MYKIVIDFVPGRPGTGEFVPGQLLKPLSRDKGTAGQGKCPCPGTKGQRDVPSRGNANSCCENLDLGQPYISF